MSKEQVRRVLVLYKRVLKLQRGLPEELRVVGNNYIRDEFKRHKSADSAQAAVFLGEWAKYALILADQLSSKGLTNRSSLGKRLNETDFDSMNDEQIQQLFKLKQETDKNINL